MSNIEIIIDNSDNSLKEVVIDNNIIDKYIINTNNFLCNYLMILIIILYHFLFLIISCIFLTSNINLTHYLSIMISILIIYLTTCYYIYHKYFNIN